MTPAETIEAEWQRLLNDGCPVAPAVVSAAAAEPAFRRLYPFTSMFILCFSSTLSPADSLLVGLHRGFGERHTIGSVVYGPDRRTVATARSMPELVALALPFLPPVRHPGIETYPAPEDLYPEGRPTPANPGTPTRRPLSITASRRMRRWTVSGSDIRGNELVRGRTADPAAVARAAEAWNDGTDLTILGNESPFLVRTGRLEVPDGDPAGLIVSEWQHVIAYFDTVGKACHSALLAAAWADPTLRRLRPRYTGLTLWFAETPDCLNAYPDGYTVRTPLHGDRVATTSTPQEAVAVVVERLPSAAAA